KQRLDGLAALRTLLLLVGDTVDHDLLSQLLLQRRALSTPFERSEPARFSVLFALGALQLRRRRRHLFALRPEHTPLQRFERRRRSDELARQLVEFATVLLRHLVEGLAQPLDLVTPWALMIDRLQYPCL